MERLYAPWRGKYAAFMSSNRGKSAEVVGCVFCEQFNEKNDAKFFILKRFDGLTVLLNRYPYNAGHILIMPVAHVADLDCISKEMRRDCMELANATIEILKKVLGAQGVNLGMNLGTFSGASSPEHVHMHVLPRWRGDTNFMPVLADTKIISIDLNETYQKLLPHFQGLVL